MSKARKMPFPFPAFGCLTLAVILCGIVLPLVHRARTAAREAHTRFLFTQIEMVWLNADAITNANELMGLLQSAPLDWNSCRLEDGVLYDGWGQPILTRLSNVTNLTLRSRGRDRQFETDDDIEMTATRALADRREY